MSKKPPKRPEHCPQGYEWLPDAYKRDVEPHGPEARERVRQAFAEGDIIALLRTRSGERHEIAPRMWDKEPVAEKVYPRFEDGRMRMGLGLRTERYTGRHVEGFVFVPQEKLTEAALAMMGSGKSKYEERNDLHFRSKAERECYEWLVEIGQKQKPSTLNTKDKLFQQAQKHGISGRAFDKLWQVAMPLKFKAPGARKTLSLKF